MANPTFRSGPITFKAKTSIRKFRLVTVDADGVFHASASGPVYGAVITDADVPTKAEPNTLVIGNPPNVGVFIAPATVPLEVAGDPEAATAITQGTPLYAAADGKVATSGSLLVGMAARDGADGRVKTTLLTPAVGASAPAGGE